jgi:hypothetical protein
MYEPTSPSQSPQMSRLLFPEIGHINFDALAPDQRNLPLSSSESSSDSDSTCPELGSTIKTKGINHIIFALCFHGALYR